VDAEDSSGNTPVWAAFASCHSEVARFLLEEGDADVNAACEDGKTYLHQAAQRNSADDVVWLLAHKASTKAKDKFADTSLHAAAAAGAWRIGRLLIVAGADVNARGKVRHLSNCRWALVLMQLHTQNACTPLHIAAINPANACDRASFVELLLAKGSDPRALNKVHPSLPAVVLLFRQLTCLAQDCSRPVDLVGSLDRKAADEEDDADVRHLLMVRCMCLTLHSALRFVIH
jgi:ankyrin repeat protein